MITNGSQRVQEAQLQGSPGCHSFMYTNKPNCYWSGEWFRGIMFASHNCQIYLRATWVCERSRVRFPACPTLLFLSLFSLPFLFSFTSNVVCSVVYCSPLPSSFFLFPTSISLAHCRADLSGLVLQRGQLFLVWHRFLPSFYAIACHPLENLENIGYQ